MRMTRVCNVELLKVIKDAGEITREELKKGIFSTRTAWSCVGYCGKL